MRFKTSKIKILKVSLVALKDCPASLIGQALSQLDPETKMVGVYEGLADASMTWYFTNPKYPDVPDAQMFPEIHINFSRDVYGQPVLDSVDEGFTTSTPQASFGGAYGLPNGGYGGPIGSIDPATGYPFGYVQQSNITSPTLPPGPITVKYPASFPTATQQLMTDALKKASKKINDAFMDSLVYGKGMYDFDPVQPKCECGVDAAKSGGNHSSWCPKYETQ